MSYKSVLTAVALACTGTVFAAPNESFESASQTDGSYYEQVYNKRAWANGFTFGSMWHPPQHGFATQSITAPVPEPATYALMAGGLLIVAGVARRRGRR